jgi:hypothetical protein
MKNKKVLVSITLILIVLLIAYLRNSVAIASAQPSSANTQSASTAIGNPPLNSPTFTPTASPTATFSATATESPTLVTILPPTQTFTPTMVPIPCDLAGFVADVTIPDGSTVNPGEPFTKTWRLENLGSCSCTTSYDLVFTSGDLMNGPTLIPLPGNVNPGETLDLSVNLTAPTTAGTYQGYWMLRDANGAIFGVGSDGSQPFWVNIDVNDSLEFAVTEVDTSVNPAGYSGICPVTFSFDANVWANEAGTVTYYWVRSDGSQSPEGTLTFTDAGYQTVSEEWTIGDPGSTISGWDELYIDQPNHQTFSPANFNLTCDAPTPTLTSTPTQTPAFSETPTATPLPPTIAPTLTATQPAATNTPIPTATQPAATSTLTPMATQPAATTTPAPTQIPTTTQPASTNTPTPTPTSKH